MIQPNDKTVLRKNLMDIREVISREESARQSERLVGQAANLPEIPPGTYIAGYYPVGSEIDPRPLLEYFRTKKITPALPVVITRDAPLSFRVWDRNTLFADDGFGIPTPTSTSPEVQPKVLFVPLLAFDLQGYRLGYGGGFYDRTIKYLRSISEITAIGVAFDTQGPMDIPIEEHDQQLDWVLTPAHLYKMNELKQ